MAVVEILISWFDSFEKKISWFDETNNHIILNLSNVVYIIERRERIVWT